MMKKIHKNHNNIKHNNNHKSNNNNNDKFDQQI